MVGHGGSSASSYPADPTSPIPSHCASIVVTSTLRVNTDEVLESHEWRSAQLRGFYIHVCAVIFPALIAKCRTINFIHFNCTRVYIYLSKDTQVAQLRSVHHVLWF